MSEYSARAGVAAEPAKRLRTLPVEVVTLSGKDSAGLIAMARGRASDSSKPGYLQWLARTSQREFDATANARLAIVAKDEVDLKAKLEQAIASIEKAPTDSFATPTGIHYGAGAGTSDGQLGYLFSGQGSQYLHMGASVAMTFGNAITPWDHAADFDWDKTSSLHHVVYPRTAFDDDGKRAQEQMLSATEWAQPAIGCTSLSLLGLLDGLGLEADCFAGHSFGELTALHAAGVYDEASFLDVARKRGELMAEAAVNPGAMTAVAKPIEEIRGLLEEWGTSVVIANHNAPEQVVLSGGTSDIEAVEAKLAERNITAKRLPVATAFHSPIVAKASGAFADYLADIKFKKPSKPVYSNTSGALYKTQPKAVRKVLGEQLACPVKFVDMVEAMYESGVRTFVEVGPGSVLTGLVGRILGDRPHAAVNLDRKGRDGVQSFFAAIARLAAEGFALDYSSLWSEFAETINPHERIEPKLSLPINGTNYGKLYPPKGGAAELPKPNPPRPETTKETVVETVYVEVPQSNAHTMEAQPITNPVSPAHAAPSPSAMAEQAAPVTQVGSIAGAPVVMSAGWAQAYQEGQRQTADAHVAYMQAMAETHTAFLNTIDRSFQTLAGQAGLQPALPLSPARQASPVMQTTLPAPTPAATPAPLPVTVAQPMPTTLSVPAAVPAAPAPAPVSVSAPVQSAPAPSPRVDLHALLLEVVAEKTGYPPEMLNMEMELEADLGIDSIKRVEILSAMSDLAPDLPEVDMAIMATLATLGQVVEYMNSQLEQAGGSIALVPNGTAQAPSASSVPAPGPTADIDLHALLLEVVAEKTGYPPEMLNMEMELEADLGIDSIKRVEILSAMNDLAPGLPEVDMAVMATLATLGQVVEYMNSQLDQVSGSAQSLPNGTAQAPSEKVSASPTSDLDLHALLLDVVAEKTGYPPEMLNMEMELEADLGIDSIKRVEILSAMNDLAPGLPEVDMAVMATLATLGQVVEYMNGELEPEKKNSFVGELTPVEVLEGGKTLQMPSNLGRYVLEAIEQAPIGMAQSGLFGTGQIAVTDEGTGLAEQVALVLKARGVNAIAVKELPTGDLRGVIFLGGLREVANDVEATRVNREAFAVAQTVAAEFEGRATGEGLFVTLQDTGGRFGTSEFAPERAWLSGCAGLARTVAQEWPGVSVKAIDLECAGRSGEELAIAIADELTAGGPDLDVGLSASGRRFVLRSRQVDVVRGTPCLNDGDVVVASGGARGVTATTLIGLAHEAALRFVLLGRTELVDEPACCAGIVSDVELKRVLLAEAVANGEKLTPAILGKRVGVITACREVRETIVQIEEAGSQARYLAVDVTSLASVSSALQIVRANWGGIAAVVHGAGVIADKRVAEKTADQFDRVFDTKVEGLRTLLAATAEDKLSLLCLFSSVAARCGNVGQVDYAMANEILNKVALAETQRRGAACLVKSLGWGPWEGGMVTPQLKAHFESMNVPLIPLAVGAQMLVDEVAGSAPAQVDLVLGGEPKAEALADAESPGRSISLNVVVGAETHPYLADHAINGTPVVPIVFAIEWFSRAARAFGPELVLAKLTNLQVLRGITLRDFAHSHEQLVINAQQSNSGSGVALALELTDANGGVYYRCTAELVEQRGSAPAFTDNSKALSLGSWGDAPVYEGALLFHGPDFQAINKVNGISDRGMVAELSGVAQSAWTDTAGCNASGSSWSSDPLAFDGGLQLALLWCKHVLGGASLPTGIAEIFIWSDSLNKGTTHCTLTGQSAKGNKSVSDLAFCDASGKLVAEFIGVETHLLPKTV